MFAFIWCLFARGNDVTGISENGKVLVLKLRCKAAGGQPVIPATDAYLERHKNALLGGCKARCNAQ